MTYDTTLLEDFRLDPSKQLPRSCAERILHHYDGHCKSYCAEKEFNILGSPTALLNDVCLNTGAARLQAIFSLPGLRTTRPSLRCAIFSTFDLLSVRYKSTPDQIWRRTYRTGYWEKDIWILPIHRKSPSPHWVLAVIYLHTSEIFLFDSFSCRQPWKRETKVCSNRSHRSSTHSISGNFNARRTTCSKCQPT